MNLHVDAETFEISHFIFTLIVIQNYFLSCTDIKLQSLDLYLGDTVITK